MYVISGIEELGLEYPKCPKCGNDSWVMRYYVNSYLTNWACLNSKALQRRHPSRDYPKVNPTLRRILHAIKRDEDRIRIYCMHGACGYEPEGNIKKYALNVAKKFLEGVFH